MERLKSDDSSQKTGSVKKLNWELDFADLAVKGRNVRGNIVSKLPVKRVDFREKAYQL